MRIDIINVIGLQTGFTQGVFHCAFEAIAIRIGSQNIVTVSRLAPAENFRGGGFVAEPYVVGNGKVLLPHGAQR